MQPGRTFNRDSSWALLWGKDFSCTFVLIQSKLKDVWIKVNLSVHVLAQNSVESRYQKGSVKNKTAFKDFCFSSRKHFCWWQYSLHSHAKQRAAPSQDGSWPGLWQRLPFSPLKWRKCQWQQPLFFPLSCVSYKISECTMMEWQNFQTRVSHFWFTYFFKGWLKWIYEHRVPCAFSHCTYMYFLPEIILTFGLPVPFKMIIVSLLYLNHENMTVLVRKLQGKKYWKVHSAESKSSLWIYQGLSRLYFFSPSKIRIWGSQITDFKVYFSTD